MYTTAYQPPPPPPPPPPPEKPPPPEPLDEEWLAPAELMELFRLDMALEKTAASKTVAPELAYQPG